MSTLVLNRSYEAAASAAIGRHASGIGKNNEEAVAKMTGREVREFTAIKREDIDKAARGNAILSIQAQKILGIVLLVLGILAVLFSAGTAAGIGLLDVLGGTSSTWTMISIAGTLLAGTVMTAVGATLFQKANNQEFVAEMLKAPYNVLDAAHDRISAKKAKAAAAA